MLDRSARVSQKPGVLDRECGHERCGCDGCAEALPVPVENERGECRRERLDGEEGADEEGDGGVQRARFGGSRGQAGSPAIGGPAGHQHPFELCCESGGERDAERKRELGAHSLRYRRERRSPGEWLERERVLGEPGPLVRGTRRNDDPLSHWPAAGSPRRSTWRPSIPSRSRKCPCRCA